MPLAIKWTRRSIGRTKKIRIETTGQTLQANNSRRRPPAREGITKPMISTTKIEIIYHPNDIQPRIGTAGDPISARNDGSAALMLAIKNAVLLRKTVVRISRAKTSRASIFLARDADTRGRSEGSSHASGKKSTDFLKTLRRAVITINSNGQTRFIQSAPAERMTYRNSGNPADMMSANMGMQCSRVSSGDS